MAMFLKLHNAAGGEERINIDLIESYGIITENKYKNADEYIGMTYLLPVGADNETKVYVVKETPEEIDKTLSLSPFLAQAKTAENILNEMFMK